MGGFGVDKKAVAPRRQLFHPIWECMVTGKLNRVVPMVMALALLPLGLQAQEPQPGALPALPQEAQEVLQQMQVVQQDLSRIQQEALSDPELQAEQAALGEQLQLAMAQANPQVPQQIERLEQLMGEAQQAQQNQDAEKMQQIVAEAQGLEASLQEAQAAALQRPEIAPQIQSFQDKLEAKMVEVDSSTPQLIQRLQELEMELMPYVTGQQ